MNKDELMGRVANAIKKTGLHIAIPAVTSRFKWHTRDRFKKPKVTVVREKSADKIAVFAIFQPSGMSDFCKKELLYLRKLGYDVVISAPNGIHARDRSMVEQECRIIVERDNFGRDFGSYRDAILAVGFDEFAKYERVLIVNDSIYFPLGDTTEFERRFLNNNADAIGFCENIEFAAHIGSFFIDYSSRLFCCKDNQEFWRSYKPLESRMHSIHVGEFGVSRVIYKNASRIDILYSHEHVINKMVSGDVDVIENMETINKLLGDHFRELKQTLVTTNAVRSKDIRRFVIIDEFRQKMARSSPPHSMGLLLLVFYGAPFMKRDVYFRLAVYLPGAYFALSQIESDEVRDRIIYEMRKKGTRRNLPARAMLINHLGLQ
ncbi:rhamnan synthesis F family protein [Burkholderia multivorans]|uniref:rhamnan synthesis F family protein n=1 Tax=Burkholderia multivorans TaxID=87883 RepID=UPI0015E43EB2|nr:rhamnan synthesis F family protein [Burkholderia multivorans]MBR8244796.1 hypothetical protein [Burkholderia multivorans]